MSCHLPSCRCPQPAPCMCGRLHVYVMQCDALPNKGSPLNMDAPLHTSGATTLASTRGVPHPRTRRAHKHEMHLTKCNMHTHTHTRHQLRIRRSAPRCYVILSCNAVAGRAKPPTSLPQFCCSQVLCTPVRPCPWTNCPAAVLQCSPMALLNSLHLVPPAVAEAAALALPCLSASAFMATCSPATTLYETRAPQDAPVL